MILVPVLPAAAGSGVGVGTTNADTKNPYVINGLTLNNPNDSPTDTYQIVTVGVSDQLRMLTEPLPDRDGMQEYIPFKIRKLIHIDGIIKSPTLAGLEYKVMQLHRYLDPINTFWDDSSSTMDQNKGFIGLHTNVPTTDANYGTGLIPVVAYVRSIQRPVQLASLLTGYNARFQIVLEMIDPRFYHDGVSQTVNLNLGSNTVHASLTEYPTAPVINMVLVGGTSNPTTIKRVSPTDQNGNQMEVRLNLTSTVLGAAATNGDTVTLDMSNGKVKLNGVERPDFLVAGFTAFWPVLAGSNTFFFNGSANISTRQVIYTRAFS